MNDVSSDADDERLNLVVDYFRTMPIPPCPSIDVHDRRLVVQPVRSAMRRNVLITCTSAVIAIIVAGVLWLPNFVGEFSKRDIAQDRPKSNQSNPTRELELEPKLTGFPSGLIERSPVVEVVLDNDSFRTSVRRDISDVVANLDRLAIRVTLQDARGRAQELVRSIEKLVASAN